MSNFAAFENGYELCVRFVFVLVQARSQQYPKGLIHTQALSIRMRETHQYAERMFSHRNDKSIRWQQFCCFSSLAPNQKRWRCFSSPISSLYRSHIAHHFERKKQKATIINVRYAVSLTAKRRKKIRWCCSKRKRMKRKKKIKLKKNNEHR